MKKYMLIVGKILAIVSLAIVFFCIASVQPPHTAVGWLMLFFLALGSIGSGAVSTYFCIDHRASYRWMSFFGKVNFELFLLRSLVGAGILAGLVLAIKGDLLVSIVRAVAGMLFVGYSLLAIALVAMLLLRNRMRSPAGPSI
jgi:hypothetical protein